MRLKLHRRVIRKLKMTGIVTLTGFLAGQALAVLSARWSMPFALAFGGALGGGIAGVLTAFEFFVAEPFFDRGNMRKKIFCFAPLAGIVYIVIAVLAVLCGVEIVMSNASDWNAALAESVWWSPFLALLSLVVFVNSLIVLLRILVFRSGLSSKQVNSSFLEATVTRTLIYSLMIVGLTWLIGDVMFGLDGILKDREMWMMLVFALIGIFFINIMFATARLIGPRVFVKFLTGHYYNPRQERRILMFLDMVGSTTIAEKIGDMRYYDLLTDVFERLSYVVDDFGGEIHNYVGDELIATWPVSENNTADNARPVECSVECFNMIAEHAEKLRARHGIVPGFRVGIHLGVIVAGELGGLKQAIVYLGDAMNTASRIERACRIEDKSILVSQALVDIAKLPPDIHVEPIGERQLKGRREPIHLHAVGFDEVKA